MVPQTAIRGALNFILFLRKGLYGCPKLKFIFLLCPQKTKKSEVSIYEYCSYN